MFSSKVLPALSMYLSLTGRIYFHNHIWYLDTHCISDHCINTDNVTLL